jgi:DnaJ-class molecular chaperone
MANMDYYSTLGLRRGASEDEIKKAYRSMAMKYHPDRGGDEKKFKEIEEAYRFLSDPQKKNIIDMGGDPNAQPDMGNGGFYRQGPFEFHFGGHPGMEDIFTQFGFGFQNRRPMRNKSYNVNIRIRLEDVLEGKDVDAEIGLSSGKKKLVNIKIPPGIQNGQNIRYQGMGDDAIKDSAPGDLIVNIFVDNHPKFIRDEDQLIYNHNISVWDAMLGTNLKLETLDKKFIDINIPAGTQPETVLSCRGEGLPNIRTKKRGNLLIKISVAIPRLLSKEQRSIVENLKSDVKS